MLKRVIDILIATLSLFIFFPFLCIAALLVKLTSEGPVLFRQTRMGKDFLRFQLLKLRTMHSSSQGAVYTLGHDARITVVGRWLRWWKVDELPQLWNVLRGEMSLVGPRPVVPQLTEEFHAEYVELLKVRPGLTDPATSKYCRESEMLARVPDPMAYFKTVVTPDKLRLSRDYLLHATLWRDLSVLAETAWALFRSAFCAIPGQIATHTFKSTSTRQIHGEITATRAPAAQLAPSCMKAPADTIQLAAGSTHVSIVFARSAFCQPFSPSGRRSARRLRWSGRGHFHSRGESRS